MKSKRILISTIIFTVLAFAIYKGADYYQDRYRGTEYFFKVPDSISQELEPLYDMDSNEMDIGKEYKFTVINEDLETKIIEFAIITDDTGKLLKPGEYLRVIASEQISLSETRINKEEVPSAIIEYLDELN